MRSIGEANAIERILKARGIGPLGEPGVVEALSRLVENHDHFGAMLRACEPDLRREMYNAMSPNLSFRPKALEDYIIAAKERASAREFPTIDQDGNLQPYSRPSINPDIHLPAGMIVTVELWVSCSRCSRELIVAGERRLDAISKMREMGWAFDELGSKHLCPACLAGIDTDAMDSPAS